MQVNNNINSMVQLEKRLEESASALLKLNTTNSETDENNNQNLDKKPSAQLHDLEQVNITEEIVQQIQIPIAYSVNANVISVQNATQKTILDIKV